MPSYGHLPYWMKTLKVKLEPILPTSEEKENPLYDQDDGGLHIAMIKKYLIICLCC